jgi:hypothetical protein
MPITHHWFARFDLVKPTEMSVGSSLGLYVMDSTAANDVAKHDVGLPPVKPPSGRFIAQLFVIPGLIIFVVVLLFIGSAMWIKREHEPEHFLRQLDSDNHDIRWRGMNDLAQILKRTEPAALRWKSDPKFALELTERMDRTFRELLDEEKSIADQIAKSDDKDKQLLWRKLREKRDYVIFLAGALGEFQIPVGAPVLCAMIRYDGSPDLNGNTLQRRKALWGLMNMGENLKGFAKLPEERRQSILAELKEEAAKSGPRAGWASTALFYIDKSVLPSDAFKHVVKVDDTLAVSADAEDRFLRELTAMAFNYWDGDRAEETLLKLANDRGQGTLLPVAEND